MKWKYRKLSNNSFFFRFIHGCLNQVDIYQPLFVSKRFSWYLKMPSKTVRRKILFQIWNKLRFIFKKWKITKHSGWLKFSDPTIKWFTIKLILIEFSKPMQQSSHLFIRFSYEINPNPTFESSFCYNFYLLWFENLIRTLYKTSNRFSIILHLINLPKIWLISGQFYNVPMLMDTTDCDRRNQIFWVTWNYLKSHLYC